MTNPIKLEDLFSDSGPFDEAEVLAALHPAVTIQNSTKHIFIKNDQLSAEQKILAYGLAKKLLKFKGLVDNEMITAQEVHEKTGMKKGTIDPKFKSLREKGLILGKKDYEIPTHTVKKVIEMLKIQG